MTLLFVAACSEAETATITGHSLRSVRAVLDANYLSRVPELGETAIRNAPTENKDPDRSAMF